MNFNNQLSENPEFKVIFSILLVLILLIILSHIYRKIVNNDYYYNKCTDCFKK